MKSPFFLRNFLPDNPKIDLVRFRVLALVASSILIIATMLGLFSKSLNFGVDFTGGLLFEVKFSTKQDLGLIRSELGKLGIGEVVVQTIGEGNEVLIRAGVSDESNQSAYVYSIKDVLSTKIDPNVEFRKIEFVGAEVGSEMVKKGIMALTLTFVGITLYIWFRFSWQYSVGIAAGLAHDLLLTIGFLVLTRYEFNLTSIAALLTVLGYSVNDTVVIYDRVREKMRISNKTDIAVILNTSINETLSRTILTVLTTLLAALVLILYAGPALKTFSITVFVGIIIGTYSSIFTSVPILYFLLKKKA